MALRGRPPSAKTLVDRQLGRNKNIVLPAGDTYIVPNHSGEHTAGTTGTPTADRSIVNKKYVDDQFPVTHASTTGKTTDDHHDQDHQAEHQVGGGDLVYHDSLTGFVANEHINWTNATQDFKTTGEATVDDLIITAPTLTDYKLTHGTHSKALAVECQQSGQPFRIDYYTKDGDGSDNLIQRTFAKGTTSAITNSEFFDFIYDAANRRWTFRSLNAGTGTILPIHLYTGAYTYQLVLDIDGSVRMGSSSNYAQVSSGGDLTFVGGAGLPFGVIAGDDQTITCTTQNTWYQVTFDEAGDNNLITLSTANNDMTIPNNGKYDISAHFSGHCATSQDFEIQIKKNNGATNIFHGHMFQTMAVANRVEGSAINTIDELLDEETLELWVRCTSAGAKSIIFDHVSLKAIQVGGMIEE